MSKSKKTWVAGTFCTVTGPDGKDLLGVIVNDHPQMDPIEALFADRKSDEGTVQVAAILPSEAYLNPMQRDAEDGTNVGFHLFQPKDLRAAKASPAEKKTLLNAVKEHFASLIARGYETVEEDAELGVDEQFLPKTEDARQDS